MATTNLKAPFAAPDFRTIDAPTAAGQEIEINSNNSYIKLTGLTGATTLNLSVGDELEAGARLVLEVVQGGTGRNVTLGDNMEAPNLTGVASDVDNIELIYDGSDFRALSGWYKIVDAA